MIAASFLTKHLMVHYRYGEEHYLHQLVDGDVALNNMGWQWSAGCGCDAQPYFRVFNPVLQGQKFDPDGAYVRRYVPELSHLPSRFVHRPWEASAEILAAAKVKLGVDYPMPIVEHRFARQRFLTQAKNSLRETSSSERVVAG
jgi:deoxyribodipyrimidine photo-lyase